MKIVVLYCRHRPFMGHQSDESRPSADQVLPNLRLPREQQPAGHIVTMEKSRRCQGLASPHGMHFNPVLQGKPVSVFSSTSHKIRDHWCKFCKIGIRSRNGKNQHSLGRRCRSLKNVCQTVLIMLFLELVRK